MKAVPAQVDSMQPDREDGGKGWVLIDDSGPLLIWGVGLLLLNFTSSGGTALQPPRDVEEGPPGCIQLDRKARATPERRGAWHLIK